MRKARDGAHHGLREAAKKRVLANACLALWLCLVAGVVVTAGGCAASNNGPPSTIPTCAPKPTGGLLATFQHGNRYFWVSISNPTGMQQAIDAWAGRTRANIPVGQLVCNSIAWNCGWSWHLDPQTVHVAEAAIELCDGVPPASQQACLDFSRNTGGTFCPWSARLVELRDCRTDASCPLIPR